MKDVIELQSKTIDWLRFPLAVAVIFIHVNPSVDTQGIDYSSISGESVYRIIASLGSNVMTHIAVPCFYVFSGYLFFYKMKDWNKSVYLQKIKKRLKTLVIPYLLWNLILILLLLIIKFIKMDGSIYPYINELTEKGFFNIFWSYTEWGSTNTNILGWRIPNYGPFILPLWFLRDLIVVSFISPVIYYLIKLTKIYGIILIGILYYTNIFFIFPGFSSATFLLAFFYFSLGAYFSINKKNLIISFRSRKYFWFIIAFVFLILTTYYDGTKTKDYFYPIYIVSGVISVVNIASFLIEKQYVRGIKALSNASFFIYTAHTIFIMEYASKIVKKIFYLNTPISMIIKYFAIAILCLLICLTFYFLMKKFTPKLLNVLTGNR